MKGQIFQNMVANLYFFHGPFFRAGRNNQLWNAFGQVTLQLELSNGSGLNAFREHALHGISCSLRTGTSEHGNGHYTARDERHPS
jgi:hypothetical protein